MDTIFPEEDTTMNPYGEYSTFESDEKKNTEKTFFTTTPMEDTKKLTPQELYTKYANTVPPFPLFPNVTPPSFPNLSAAQQNSCSSAEIDYTKQIKEAASYINQEKFDVKLPLGIEKIKNKLKKKKPTVVEDPIAQAAAVIQQALNISNSSSLNCIFNWIDSTNHVFDFKKKFSPDVYYANKYENKDCKQ